MKFVAIAVFAGVVFSACGLDALVFTPRDFDPTPPPAVTLNGVTDPSAIVEVFSSDGRRLVVATADGGGAFSIALPAQERGENLVVLATRDTVRTKTIVARAPTGSVTDVGQLDSRTTARTQLAIFEVVEEAGSTLAATPSTALSALLSSIDVEPSESFLEFAQAVDAVSNAATIQPYTATGFGLIDGAVPIDVAVQYLAGLRSAAADYGLVVRCDPSRLNVMFAVDVSGRGRDGNGTPQLIRQPNKEGRVFLGFTADESSPVTDESIPRRLTPNDVRFAMTDDGLRGDEEASDGIFTVVVPLPRGARLLYKYTNGAAGAGFTGAEEWPGNARIIEVDDVITGRPDGEPDCLVVRRDSFGDEATNKNFVNLHPRAKSRGGTVTFDTDLGGADLPTGPSGALVGGIARETGRDVPGLTPAGVPEARENGTCVKCPAPLVLDPDDVTPPELNAAERLSITRVRVRFSEPILAADAELVSNYLYLDDAGRAVPVLRASPSGADVFLTIEPTHPRAPAVLEVRSMRDASVRQNVLGGAEVNVGVDRTPPRLLSVTPRSILDLEPESEVVDPTIGDIIDLVFDEAPELSAASDPMRYRIDGLEIIAATLLDEDVPRVRLATAVMAKGAPYDLVVDGMRDPAGNALRQELPFDGFALYRVTFSVVPGFAFASSAGTTRGVARGEALYLTGTPLASARDPMGRDVSIVNDGYTRTDLTGWPQFELAAGARTHEGAAVYQRTLLLPRGSWAWKAAHGVEGEYVRPPTTLEKVYKTLATANDATGVRVDPVTMIAENGESYLGASLSEDGDEPPRASVVFKREAPDEVCIVHRDTECPLIVVGAWRDLVLDPGGQTRDYDDGIITLPPHRPQLPDTDAPKLLDARARDSFSVLLSFDETIVDVASTLTVNLTRAADGVGVRTQVMTTNEVRPHQAVIRLNGNDCAAGLDDGAAYTVAYRGARNVAGLVQRDVRRQTILAPERCVPFTPLTDRSPPKIAATTATDLTALSVQFDERLDPATVDAGAFSIDGGALAVSNAVVLPDRRTALLTTAPQSILAEYELTVTGVADAADPPNVLTSTSVSFVGFGERTPPTVERVRAIDRDRVLVRFDEPVDATSAMDPSNYSIAGVVVRAAEFADDPGRRPLAFSSLAPRIRNVVVLQTDTLDANANYELTVDGVRDRSGNVASVTTPFTGVDAPPTVDVVLEVEVSDRRAVAGSIPSRSIALATLMDGREGVFVLGARATLDHTPAAGHDAPVNDALRGFGVEGQPLDGIEPRLIDTGAAPDVTQGDGVFSILIPDVPLQTTIIWKAFAPYSTTYRDRNPSDSMAAFADALPGPSVFADGQEFPGNENGVVVLDDGDGDGVLYVRTLFGDEITFKKNTGGAAYVWAAEDRLGE